MIRMLVPAIAGATLVACATTPAETPIEDREAGPGENACNAEAGQRFIGQMANADTGAQIMAATGARSLRWGPPGAVFTMDFRPDRVNVMYDERVRITEIRCG